LRRGFPRFVYGRPAQPLPRKEADGLRVPRTLPQAPAWFGCFDVVQLNEDEMSQLGPNSLAIAADALRQGCSTLCVTLGKRGAAYFTGNPIRTELIPAPVMHQAAFDQVVDPTGCGDVVRRRRRRAAPRGSQSRGRAAHRQPARRAECEPPRRVGPARSPDGQLSVA